VVNRAGLLPGQIPPQTIPLVAQSPTGEMITDINWYLYFYNLGKNVLMNASGGIPFSSSTSIALIDSDVVDSDAMQAPRQILNAMLLQLDADIGPSLRDVQNALLLSQDGVLPDAISAAQPSSAVTVGASPFIYTAQFNGSAAVSGGTVSAIAIIRRGVTVATGMTFGLFPLSRLDQIQITYTVAPVIVFLPS